MASKINQVLQKWPTNTVATARWLRSEGIDHRLANTYVRSGWLNRIDHGAYMRAGSDIDWTGGIFAVQTQLGIDVHIGSVSAFELQGYAHYLALGGREVVLFGKSGIKLPAWFMHHQWSAPVRLVTSNALQYGTEYTVTTKVEGIELTIASLELAAFEMMYLVPNQQPYEEAVQILESLTILRPQVVQQLLESCSSVKTKRLFMHAAEQHNLPWLTDLDLSNVDFGSGRRSIHMGGKLDYKYNLVVSDPIE